MYREVSSTLRKWQYQQNRKPIILRGARQVGKSHIVKELSKNFEHFIEINFEETPSLKKIFEGDLSPEIILRGITSIYDTPIIDGKTLLFFDEIQLCPQAINALRYFYEKRSQLHVISAGSLIEFEIEKIGVPVGRVESIYIYPLSFKEFLTALKKDFLISEVNQNFKEISEISHIELLKLVALYCHLGGMPEVVADYIEQDNFSNTTRIQNSLINSYRQDFSKYASKFQIESVSEVFDSIPRQITKKFVYSSVNQNIKSSKLNFALDLLTKAGVAKKIYHSSSNGVPLASEIKQNLFKVVFMDIGLALRMLGANLYKSRLGTDEEGTPLEDFSLNYINKGAITEQFVAQELMCYQDCYSPANVYYWIREALNSNAEIDYVISLNDKVLPIEVKSGKNGNLKSLHQFLKEKLQVKTGYRISSRKYEESFNITSLPLYAIWKLFEQN